MKEYKGYQIPDTYEEIKEYTNKHFIKDALLQPGIPSLSFTIEDSKISVPITIEEFANAEDNEFKRNLMVSTYVDCIIAFIAHKESEGKYMKKDCNKKLEDYTLKQIMRYCLSRVVIGGCSKHCKMWNICNTIRTTNATLAAPEIMVYANEETRLEVI